jgi:hypothetical protein
MLHARRNGDVFFKFMLRLRLRQNHGEENMWAFQKEFAASDLSRFSLWKNRP